MRFYIVITIIGYGKYKYPLNTWRHDLEVKYIMLNGSRYFMIYLIINAEWLVCIWNRNVYENLNMPFFIINLTAMIEIIKL